MIRLYFGAGRGGGGGGERGGRGGEEEGGVGGGGGGEKADVIPMCLMSYVVSHYCHY